MIKINSVMIIGRITKDLELRYLNNDKAVMNFTLAVNRNFTNQNGEREADFISIVVFDKQAENLKKYCSKGSQVAIDGRIQTRNYENQDGKKVYVTEVIADNIQFLDSKSSSNGQVKEKVTPSNFERQTIDDEPFREFGETIESDDIEF